MKQKEGRQEKEEKDTINLHSIVTYIPPEESIDNFCFRQQTTTIPEQNYNKNDPGSSEKYSESAFSKICLSLLMTFSW